MCEYLYLEFHDIESTLAFDYNLERVIDDFYSSSGTISCRIYLI